MPHIYLVNMQMYILPEYNKHSYTAGAGENIPSIYTEFVKAIQVDKRNWFEFSAQIPTSMMCCVQYTCSQMEVRRVTLFIALMPASIRLLYTSKRYRETDDDDDRRRRYICIKWQALFILPLLYNELYVILQQGRSGNSKKCINKIIINNSIIF